MTFESLIVEYADLHRQLRIARGYNDYNLDQVIQFAVADLLNLLKRSGSDALELLKDEVAFERECLERVRAGS